MKKSVSSSEKNYINEPCIEDFLAENPSELPFLNGVEESCDTMTYHVFIDNWKSLDRMRDIRDSLVSMALETTKDYIWHRDSFDLSLNASSLNDSVEPSFYGKTTFGDNLDDEWLIVHILMKASLKFESEGFSVSVSDNDGEFLLIEAADELPAFFEPSNSKYRVWIRSGQIHFVLPEPAEKQGNLSLYEGISLLRSRVAQGKSVASNEVQKAISRKLSFYGPEHISNSIHYARAYLPCGVAAVLQAHPFLISLVVKMYCYRTPDQGKQAIAMKFLGNQHFVESRIKFSRHLYSQISTSAVLHAPIAFSSNWDESKSKHLSKASKEKAKELGQKLAIGMELLYIQCGKLVGSNHKSIKILDSIHELPNEFIEALNKFQYFDGVIIGSKGYKEKLNLAKEFVSKRGYEPESLKEDKRLQNAFLLINNVLGLLSKESFPSDPVHQDDDDDSWLKIDPKELESMYTRGSSYNSNNIYNNDIDAGMDTFNEMIDGMNEFMRDSSTGIEGAEIPSLYKDVDFDVDKFIRLMEGKDDDFDSFFESDHFKDIELEHRNLLDSDADSDISEKNNGITEMLYEHDSDDEVEFGSNDERTQNIINSDNNYISVCMSAMKEQIGEHEFDIETEEKFRKEAIKSLAKAKKVGPLPAMCTNEDDNWEYESRTQVRNDDVDIDMNMVEQLMKSFMAQDGQPGPVSSLFREMGIGMPAFHYNDDASI